MQKVMAIVRREFISYFSSPLAYIVLTAFLLMQGYIFYLIVSFLNTPGTGAMTPLQLFFGGTLFFWLFLLFVVPVITMRLVAEERRSGTLEVLLTSPVSEAQVILGRLPSAAVRPPLQKLDSSEIERIRRALALAGIQNEGAIMSAA